MSDVLPFHGLGGPPAAPGVVHLVGSGPGDVGALTLRAATVLATCDVVAYDRLAPAEVLALVPPHADRIDVGRRAGDPGPGRDEVDALLRERAAAGQAVVRLKGGDPFVFGRGGEEAAACVEAGVPFEVVPGVTSAVAVPGAAGIPVTHRAVSTAFAVVTAHEDPTKPAEQLDHAALAAFPGTLVLLMGLRRVRELCEQLVANGRDPATPAAVVSAGTTAQQRTVVATVGTLADAVAAAGSPAPATIVVGDVVGWSARLGTRERRPLHGARVVLPRSRRGPSALAGHLRHAGVAVIEVELAREEPADVAAVARLAADVRDGRVATLVVLDPQGLPVLLRALGDLDLDARALASTTLCTVGRTIARRTRRDLHLRPDVELATPQALADTSPLRGPVVVLATPDDPRLGALPADARVVATSRSRPHDEVVLPAADAVLVPASRLVPMLLAAGVAPEVPLVAMGPMTAAALRDHGRPATIEAERPTPAAVIAALDELLGRR